MTYRKLAHVGEDVTAGILTPASVLADVESGELKVVNLKGLILTAAQVSAYLGGDTTVETVEYDD